MQTFIDKKTKPKDTRKKNNKEEIILIRKQEK